HGPGPVDRGPRADHEQQQAGCQETLIRRAAIWLTGHGVGDAEKKIAPEPGTTIVLMSAAGRLFTQETARRYAKLERMILICGRYEGVDERVAEHLATEELCIGDYVVSGGELPAALVVDAVTRLLPGAVGNEASTQNESFSESGGSASKVTVGSGTLLDFPHYTRPAEYRGWKVPEVLIGGNHAEVAKWRRQQALEKTRRQRPELLGENSWGKTARQMRPASL
ncbi:MAG: tRNA (guanine(37)-N(1))-methyltransferase, partial [Terriglobales bacterium]